MILQDLYEPIHWRRQSPLIDFVGSNLPDKPIATSEHQLNKRQQYILLGGTKFIFTKFHLLDTASSMYDEHIFLYFHTSQNILCIIHSLQKYTFLFIQMIKFLSPHMLTKSLHLFIPLWAIKLIT